MWDINIASGDPTHPDSVVWWSNQLRELLGFDNQQDFPDRLESWRERLHPEDQQGTLNAFAAHPADASGRTPYDIQWYRLAHRNGNYRWFRARGTTLRNAFRTPFARRRFAARHRRQPAPGNPAGTQPGTLRAGARTAQRWPVGHRDPQGNAPRSGQHGVVVTPVAADARFQRRATFPTPLMLWASRLHPDDRSGF
ncbi:MAG: PAS domain-containing protein [Zoogloea sp.]|nr:PAS domain-containing protein [Zoogloea sp.]